MAREGGGGGGGCGRAIDTIDENEDTMEEIVEGFCLGEDTLQPASLGGGVGGGGGCVEEDQPIIFLPVKTMSSSDGSGPMY